MGVFSGFWSEVGASRSCFILPDLGPEGGMGCLSILQREDSVGMGERISEGVMEELGVNLGAKLKLSEKERSVLVIGMKEVEEALVGFNLCAVVEVLTTKEVNRDVFIDRFTSLWRGRSGVSIRDLGSRRFLARFVSEQDLTRVTKAEQPWMYKDDLVMTADRSHAGKDRWAPLTHGNFWVQLHNIPP